jgi:hypothetical protein
MRIREHVRYWTAAIIIALVYLILTAPANASESFFRMEVGLGGAISKGMGDGTWIQYGVSDQHQQLTTPAYLAGFTGDITNHLSWHADYVYFGQQSASCTCVPDSQYNAHTHTASEAGYIPFSGTGHVQGVVFTLEPSYTWHGYRFAVEAGPWIGWNTWHESRLDPAYPTETNLSHKTSAQISWVVGASISRGTFTLSYRYYNLPQKWNPYPGFVTGTHMVMVKYRF